MTLETPSPIHSIILQFELLESHPVVTLVASPHNGSDPLQIHRVHPRHLPGAQSCPPKALRERSSVAPAPAVRQEFKPTIMALLLENLPVGAAVWEGSILFKNRVDKL